MSHAKSEPKENSAGRPKSKALPGTWKDLTDSVNSMAEDLTSEVRNIADVTIAVAKGDLSRKITVWSGAA